MTRPSVFYPYLVDRIGSVQTIHRELAKRLHHTYSFTGFVWEDPELVADYFNSYVNVDDHSRPVKSYLYSKPYLKKYDVIHSGQPKHFMRNLYFTRLASALGGKVVYTIHTPFDVETPPGQYLQRSTEVADVVTAVYPYVKEWAEQSLGLDDVRLVSNGVDLDFFRPDRTATDPDKILYAARFSQDKNPEFPVTLARLCPDREFHIAGGYPSDADAIDDDIPDNAIFHGPLQKPELASMYAGAAALLCPFEEHGAGMVALEAAASGTPVIALDMGASSTTVPDGVGIRCDSLDPQSWIDAIQTLLNDPPELAPRETVTKHSWDSVASSYDDIYQELISADSGGKSIAQ